MHNTFPTPSDVVSGLRLMYADSYASGPYDSLFSLLLHSNGQLAGTACLPTHATEDTLRACAQEHRDRALGTAAVLVAVCDHPAEVLTRAATHYRPYPRMLIGLDSLQSGYWHEYTTGDEGKADRSELLATRRFLGHWDFCRFSETFSRDRWSYARPTRFKSIDVPLERFTKSIASGRSIRDHSRTGGLLVYSEYSRDRVIGMVDINPANALELFTAAAKNLSGQARVEALVAAGVAAFFAGRRPIAEHAYMIAVAESKEDGMRFDDRLLSALGALVTDQAVAGTATDLLKMYPPVGDLAARSTQSA